ncbi:MAG: galactokinase [Acidimicrobiia bacterium]|nr:galactokinase [Acidimicrobiia bacterium]
MRTGANSQATVRIRSLIMQEGLDAFGPDQPGLTEADPHTFINWVRAPGRVNLIGDHTDYNQGLCLPTTLDYDCIVAYRARHDQRVRIRTIDEIGPDGSVPPAVVLQSSQGEARNDAETSRGAWWKLAEAVMIELAELNKTGGVDLIVSSEVPIGSGLSSSAAFSVGITLAMAQAFGAELSKSQIVHIAQAAEQRARGLPVGILDPYAITYGMDGYALLLDCKTETSRPIPIPTGLSFAVIDSGVSRNLEDSSYADRQQRCAEAAARLGVESLREATTEHVNDDPIAHHVVSENARVASAADALERGNVMRLAALMQASHESLRDDYCVSTPEIDDLVDRLLSSGALAARITGAGFGGAVVALIEGGLSQVQMVTLSAVAGYEAAHGRLAQVWPVLGADGARSFDPMKPRT